MSVYAHIIQNNKTITSESHTSFEASIQDLFSELSLSEFEFFLHDNYYTTEERVKLRYNILCSKHEVFKGCSSERFSCASNKY